MVDSECHFFWYVLRDTWYSTVYNTRMSSKIYKFLSRVKDHLTKDVIWLPFIIIMRNLILFL
jgi:hypothetical protein